ncbi:pectinesterase inhibitor-like [Magnolia sinica]|uniref:pectinesterase inhibitor-like n=1 Tax=Magnolia sinica TaxID=86752 RepID=UPI00265A674C|nr:pectinesterase inhibitor-like [Magnolia sinica]
MAHLHFFLLLSLTFSFVGPTFGDTELIQNTCKQTLYNDLCVSSLTSDPASSTADLPSLAIIALKLAYASALNMEKVIEDQSKVTTDPFMQQCLSDCTENFLDAIDQVEDSISALDSKGYSDVNTWVTAAMADSESCEEEFKDQPGYQSPFTAQNEEFQKLCSNALAITNLLSG